MAGVSAWGWGVASVEVKSGGVSMRLVSVLMARPCTLALATLSGPCRRYDADTSSMSTRRRRMRPSEAAACAGKLPPGITAAVVAAAAGPARWGLGLLKGVRAAGPGGSTWWALAADPADAAAGNSAPPLAAREMGAPAEEAEDDCEGAEGSWEGAEGSGEGAEGRGAERDESTRCRLTPTASSCSCITARGFTPPPLLPLGAGAEAPICASAPPVLAPPLKLPRCLSLSRWDGTMSWT